MPSLTFVKQHLSGHYCLPLALLHQLYQLLIRRGWRKGTCLRLRINVAMGLSLPCGIPVTGPAATAWPNPLRRDDITVQYSLVV